MTVDAVELTRDLVRYKTINPPGDEEACVRHIGRLLEGAGFECRYVAMGERRTNLIARIGGQSESTAPAATTGAPRSRLPLAFTGHVDVVPLGAAPWSVDPFGAEVKDGRIWGRGASDMKSGVAAFVAAAIEAAPKLTRGRGPGVVLVVTAGEETGCDGAHHLVRTASNLLGKAGALVVAEPTTNAPVVGHKGALRLKLTARGVTAHGSMPEKGVNAVTRLARAVARLDDFDFNVARHPVMGPPTLNVGWMHGGMNINSVPDLAEVGLDIRTIPAQRHAEVERQIASFVGPEIEVSVLDQNPAVWTDPGDAWIATVFRVAEAVTGQRSEVTAAPYFTDASALTPGLGGLPTIILGPGPAALAHQTDEWVEIARIAEAKDIYARLIAEWNV